MKIILYKRTLFSKQYKILHRMMTLTSFPHILTIPEPSVQIKKRFEMWLLVEICHGYRSRDVAVGCEMWLQVERCGCLSRDEAAGRIRSNHLVNFGVFWIKFEIYKWDLIRK